MTHKRRTRIYCSVLACVSFFNILAKAEEPKIIGYAMNPASPIVQEHSAQYISDLICFSVEPNPDASINLTNMSKAGFAAARHLAATHGVRIHLAVGGWGRSEHFAAACRTPESRSIFINGLLQLCIENDLSGIDYDWEFPKSEHEYENFATLIIESKQAFAPHDLLVTTALAPWQKLQPEAYAALDRIHLMAYDFPKEHSTFQKAKTAVEGFLAQDIPPSKIYLGVPFYGRRLANPEQSAAYKTLLTQHSLTPHMDQIDGIYFNGINTISTKARYALQNNLGGIMIWELSQDSTDEKSLIRAIYAALHP